MTAFSDGIPDKFHPCNASISISVHTESEEAGARDSLNSFIPNFGKMFTDKQKADALALFIESLFSDKISAKKFVEMIIKTRFSHFECDDRGKIDFERFLKFEIVLGLSELIGRSREKFKFSPVTSRLYPNIVSKIAEDANKIKSIIDQNWPPHKNVEKEIELANYIEVPIHKKKTLIP